jgi:hypothetical protein
MVFSFSGVHQLSATASGVDKAGHPVGRLDSVGLKDPGHGKENSGPLIVLPERRSAT